MEPTLKELRTEVLKIKKMFFSHTHTMSREECNWFLTAFKDIYKPVIPINAGKPPKKKTAVEDYDF